MAEAGIFDFRNCLIGEIIHHDQCNHPTKSVKSSIIISVIV